MRARIFESKADGDSWAQATELKASFNKGDAHTGNGAYSPDGKRFYYTECRPNDSLVMVCKIFVSEWSAGEWENGKEVGQVNEPDVTSTHPAVGTFKGKEYLYFHLIEPADAVVWISGILKFRIKGKIIPTLSTAEQRLILQEMK